MTQPNPRKDSLRAECKAWRRSLSEQDRQRIDACIASNVLVLDAWRNAQTVLAYLSFGCEVDTHDLIRAAWEQGKRVALPRCVPHTRIMEWHEARSFEGLALSPFGVREPKASPVTLIDETALDPASTVALVPGLAFDAQGFRLGYGGGFYDTFLAQFPGTSIGLCRAGQLRESLGALGAVDGHDKPVDVLITETS